MRNATELLVQYAHYHRDRRNIATHFVGIPLIVFAVGVLLARASFSLGGLTLTAAWVTAGLVTLWYLSRGHLLLGAQRLPTHERGDQRPRSATLGPPARAACPGSGRHGATSQGSRLSVRRSGVSGSMAVTGLAVGPSGGVAAPIG